MTAEVDWQSAEAHLARLLPDGESPDRTRLLNEVAALASRVVSAARAAGGDGPQPHEISAALNWLDKPVFVCGHHRSGTTLLQQLLDGHPSLVVLPSEGTYFSSFSYVARSDPAPLQVDRFIADWIARLIDPNHAPHFKLGRSTSVHNPHLRFARRLMGWYPALRTARPPRARFALLLALVAAYHDLVPVASSPGRWVEKTPLNEHNTARFAAFGEARFIQMVRDPSATLASLAESYRKARVPRFATGRHARAIGRSLQRARRNQRKLGTRFLLVRYEDLTNDPQREMGRVRAFLEIPEHPSLLIPTVAAGAARSNSSFDRAEGGVFRAAQTHSLTEAEVRLVNTLAGDPAEALGYDVIRPGFLARSLIRLRHPR